MADRVLNSALAVFEGMDPTGNFTENFTVNRPLLYHFHECGNQSMLNDAWFVPDICAKPLAIWEGLQRPGTENMLCYAGQPSGDFAKEHWHDWIHPEGHDDQIFTVFLTAGLQITKWRWCQIEPDGTGYPIKHQTRFRSQVWPTALKN